MKRILFSAVAAAGLLIVQPATATVVLNLPLPALAQRSSLVVRGIVEHSRAGWDRAHRQIVTRTIIRVVEVLRGSARAGRRVIVNQPGGEVGRIGEQAEGAARFKVGEEVVVFLEPSRGHPGEHTLVSLAASKFSVSRTTGAATAIRDLSGLSFASRQADGYVRPTEGTPVTRLSLDALRAAVRQATPTR